MHVQEYQQAGVPPSFVVIDVDSQICMGFVIGSSAKGFMIPFFVMGVAIDSHVGFPYFHINIDYDTASLIPLYTKGTTNEGDEMHHSVLNYGHLLPHLATLEQHDQNEDVPYAVVTLDANHMNTSYQFV